MIAAPSCADAVQGRPDFPDMYPILREALSLHGPYRRGNRDKRISLTLTIVYLTEHAMTHHDSSDRPAHLSGVIVTPEMIEAGGDLLFRDESLGLDWFAARAVSERVLVAALNVNPKTP